MRYSRMAVNAKLGDGTMVRGVHKAAMSFISTDLQLLDYKKKECIKEGFSVSDYKTQKSGYGGTKTIYNFRVKAHENIRDVFDLTIEEVINSLDKEDLFLWYMDDGSWHKNRFFAHLYCNMLDDDQLIILMDKIEDLYGMRPRKRKDRKKDGRSYNYLYFQRDLVRKFRPEFKEFVTSIGVESMFYKFGGLDYYDPTEEAI